MTLQLTNAGINALLRAMTGDELTLSCVKIGNGAAQAAGAATDLSNPLVTLNITECTVANQRATISVTLNNSTIDAGFRLTEIGVFAQDQDDSAEEILYAYGTEPEATADYIAASGDNILEEDITIDVFVGNAENVSAIINESLVYATKAAFDAHVANHENPHAVTKAQVGRAECGDRRSDANLHRSGLQRQSDLRGTSLHLPGQDRPRRVVHDLASGQQGQPAQRHSVPGRRRTHVPHPFCG